MSSLWLTNPMNLIEQTLTLNSSARIDLMSRFIRLLPIYIAKTLVCE